MREVFVCAECLGTVGRSVFLVDVDEVDVGRDVQLAGAELAHADDPEVDALAGSVARHAEARILVGEGLDQGEIERRLRELGHGPRHVVERCAFFDVENHQPFDRELARDAQRGHQASTRAAQPLDERHDRFAPGQPRRQPAQLGHVAATNALHEAAVRGAGLAGRQVSGGSRFGGHFRTGRLGGTHRCTQGLC